MEHLAHPEASASWAYVRAVDDFGSCDPSEYIRVFPRLLSRDGGVPVALRAHMTRCLAVLAWRAMARGDAAAMGALCAASRLAAAEMTLLGQQEHGRWFHGAARRPDGAGPRPAGIGVADERRAFALVSALRREIDADALRAFDPGAAALLSFTAGIHAAYLWPEALLSHELYTAVGWLGHLWRGRRAGLPGDLADYFDDVIEAGADGAPRVRDPLLARFVPGRGFPAELRRAVLARRGGSRAPVAWPDAAADAAASPRTGDPS